MGPAAEAQKATMSKSSKLSGKEFEETFKPKSRDIAAKDLEDKGKNKNEKGKKKKSGFRKILIILMILLVLVGGAGAALYFSGSLTTVFEAIGLAPPGVGSTIEDQQAALNLRETALNEKEQSLIELQANLDAQQKALDDAASAASASAAANRTFEEIRADFTEEKFAELKQLGSIYSKMDATAAAAIMTEMYDEQQIAVIVYQMQPASAALVLANLDTVLAASVTQIMAG